MKKICCCFFLAVFFSYGYAQEIKKWKIGELQDYLAQTKTPVIVNFWATFCKPCIEEIPAFEAMAAKYNAQNVKLLLVSLDLPSYFPGKIQEFVRKNKYSSEIIWLNETDADYFCPLIDSSWTGAIPATLFYHPGTGYRRFFQQPLQPAFLEARIKEMLIFNTY